MKYQIGDKIIVLHSEEEGKVVEFINEKMVMIEVRGVRFPAYMDQIDFPYFKMFSEQRKAVKKKILIDDVRREKNFTKKKVEDGVFLHFIPVFDKDIFEDDVVDKLKVYLINQNEEAYNFTYRLLFLGEENFSLKNTIEGLSEFYLHDIDFEDVSDNPKFEFEFSLKNPHKKKVDFHEAFVKINGKKLFKKIESLQENNEASFQYEIFTIYPDKVEVDQLDMSKLNKAGFRTSYEIGESRSYLPPARTVVDLHIEKIMDAYKHLSNFEILTIQLVEFEKYFDLAVQHKLSSFIVIHGVGAGKLRDEIHEILRLKKEVKSFINQYHHLYGYGATEIIFN